MSSARRKLLRKPPIVEVSCGCGRVRLSRIFSPKPKPKIATHLKPSSLPHQSSASSWERSAFSTAVADDDDSTNTFSPGYAASPPPPPPQYGYSKSVGGFRRIGDSVAVEKDSDDPYLDFQHSILQMIVEKEIYAKQDLRELLHCFLSLNSPSNHDAIVRAFTDIWNGVFHSRRSRESLGFARVYGK